MDSKMKVLVGGLIGVNLGLVGLLLFREKSVEPARAEQTSAALPGSPLAERDGTTSYAPPAAPVVAAPPAAPVVPVEVTVPAFPSTERDRDAADRADRAELERARARRRADDRAAAERRARDVMERTRARERSGARETARIASREPVLDTARGDDRLRDEARPIERPVERALPVTVAVAPGTHIGVKLDVALHSRQVRSGDRFEASLAEDLVASGRTVARAGSPVTGRVTEVVEAGRVKGREQMRLSLSDLTLAGKTYPVETSSLTFTSEEDHGRDAAVIGSASAIGAIIGAIAKGGKGAAVGAISGGAAGTGVVLSTKGKPVVLAAGSRLDFTLEEGVRVTLPPGELAPARAPEERREQDRENGGIARR